MGDEQTGAATGAADQPQTTNQDTPMEGVPEDLQGIAQKGKDGKAFVPVDALTDERGKRQGLEAEVKQLKDQVFLYQMNAPKQPQEQPKADPVQTTEAVIPEFLEGMADDDVVSAGELKRVIKGMKPATATPAGPQYDERQWEAIGEQMLSTFVPDVQEVFRGDLTAKLQDPGSGPLLMQTIRNAPPLIRPFVAYRMAKGESATAAVSGAKKDAAKVVEKKEGAKKIVENAQKPTPTSAITGAGAFDEASRFVSMSDEDFEKEVQRTKNLPPAGTP
jgi:hypothetical protein